MRRFKVIAAIALALVLAPAASAQESDAKAYGELLAKYVVQGGDGLNRVRYGAWRASPSDRQALDRLIKQMEAAKPSAMPREDAFAYWANLYNAVTLKVILDNYPVESIRDIRSTGAGLLDFKAFTGPWRTKRVTVEGKPLSLDDIEHEIMRPTFKDPRVHYTVNCASIGCPNLDVKPWAGATLEADLEAAARKFINTPRGVRFDANGKLTVASIYHWFEEDFGGDQKGVIAHLERYADPELAKTLAGRTGYDGHDYDWGLNEAK